MERALKWLSFGCLLIIIPVMGTATVLEKIYGTEFAREHLYVSVPVIILWGIFTFFSLWYILCRKLYKRPATLCLHLSFVVILAGALTTHLSGKEGRLHLREDDSPAKEFTTKTGETIVFPFEIGLKSFSPEYYPGTFSPSDFISRLTVTDDDTDDTTEVTVSMNNILSYKNFRFYQSGYDPDGKGTVLSVSKDPYGIAVTYTGYCWLLLSIIGFFFERKSNFRSLIHSPVLKRGVFLLLIAGPVFAVQAKTPPSLPEETAERFGDLYVYYNDRIAPLHTLAKDFTVKLYGKERYKGLTPEQVLTGWFFFYDDWKHEPLIKVKGKEVQKLLGGKEGHGKFVSLTDFNDVSGYKLEPLLQEGGKDARDAADANEKFNLISSLVTGSLLKIYPYDNGEGLAWYSLADRPSEDMPYDQWLFIRGSMDIVAEKIALKDFKGAGEILAKIRKYQLKEGEGRLPSETRVKAENFYNRSNCDRYLAMGSLTVGILLFFIFILRMSEGRSPSRTVTIASVVIMILLFLYLTMQITLRWIVGNHIPLSNGFETMQFLAWSSALLTFFFVRRFRLSLPFGFIVAGFALLVAMMGESSPKVTNLMPVLQSPLLSIHVMVIMLSYALLAFIMLNGVAGIIFLGVRHWESADYLCVVSRLLLYPAVFLLALGIFIGAVWANVSWGRYWGWDPKEVWALITFLIYSLALHSSSLKSFRRPLFFHVFSVCAFLAVLITYFGVNFILGGLHSYA